MIRLYKADIDPKYLPDFYATIDKKFKGNVDAFVDDMFAKSIFTTTDKLKAFLAKPDMKILSKDPAFIVAKSIAAVGTTLQKDLAGFSADLSKGQRTYLAGVMEYAPDKTQYPDANFTMRLTYGKVLDYYPYDAVHYNWYTTLDGVIQKYKEGDYEFDLPERCSNCTIRKSSAGMLHRRVICLYVSSQTMTSRAVTRAVRSSTATVNSSVWPLTATGKR